MAELNFATRMLLPAVVLILLSAAALAEDSKRCYWCGPLAEQVHRSQRAPSCEVELQETMCDPGYTHCAIVATSPPYAESRLCVKFYQDECYSLYCNTSKTWRMICPCQGSLCNGQNTDRENRAFATLTKNAAINKRNKRDLKAAKGFLPISPRKRVQYENSSITTPMQFDETMGGHIDMIPTTSMILQDVLEEHDVENDLNNNIEENTEVEQEREPEMQGTQPIQINKATTENESKPIEEKLNVEQTGTTKTIDDIIMSSVAPMVVLENKDGDTATEETQDIPTITSIIPTSIEIEVLVVHNKNSDDNLPPPEALQQNVSPSKETTPTTMGSTEMITNTVPIITTTNSIKHITKTIDKAQETKNNKDGTTKMDEKNGEESVQLCCCVLFYIVNLFIYVALAS